MMRGEIREIVLLPSPTFLPLWTALATGAFFLSLLFKTYWLTPLAVIAVVALFMLWTPASGLRRNARRLNIGHGESAVTQYESDDAPSYWAMVFTLLADSTLFASLVFALLFLWVTAPGWPPPELVRTGLVPAMIGAAGLVLAAASAQRALAAPRLRRVRDRWIGLTGTGHVLTLAATGFLAWAALPDPTAHAYAATSGAMLAFLALHSAIGFVFAGFCFYRSRAGYMSERRTLDLRIALPWHRFTAATGLLVLALVYGLPWMLGA